MSLQTCPKCRNESFTWSCEDNRDTDWYCPCGYHATENEALEEICDFCKTKTRSQLNDKHKIYWWCSKCNRTKTIQKL